MSSLTAQRAVQLEYWSCEHDDVTKTCEGGDIHRWKRTKAQHERNAFTLSAPSEHSKPPTPPHSISKPTQTHAFFLTRLPPSFPPSKQTAEVDTSKRAAMRAAAEAEQATTLHETAKAEVRLTGERADEAVAAVARATREAATALEETRRMYEERVEASHADRDARVRAAEERARAAEHERQRAEAARQAASKELARLQVYLCME